MNDIGFNRNLFHALMVEKANNLKSGIWGFTQREFAYNSTFLRVSSNFTFNNVTSLFDTGTIKSDRELSVKEIEEVTGHFVMFDTMLDFLYVPLDLDMVKFMHKSLKQGVYDDISKHYAIGNYKTKKNFSFHGVEVAMPSEVPLRMEKLMSDYWYYVKTLRSIAAFHVEFERIHPFQDGNGRVGRMIMFRECLTHGVTPFIIRRANAKEYIDALILAQNGNIEPLVGYFMKEQKWYANKVHEILVM